jgi:hypothetical protein
MGSRDGNFVMRVRDSAISILAMSVILRLILGSRNNDTIYDLQR